MMVVWFDDDVDRVEKWRRVIEHDDNLGSGGTNQLVIVGVEANVFSDNSPWLLDGEVQRANVILIDHYYTRTLNLPLNLQGTSLANLVRTVVPEVPICCVTAGSRAVAGRRSIDEFDLSEYLDVFNFESFAESLGQLGDIARDYPTLVNRSKEHPREALADCLKAPNDIRQNLIDILPDEISQTRTAINTHYAARWILHTFTKRPGFLSDELAVATLIGLTQSGFRKVKHLFVDCLYDGVFCSSEKPLWWDASVLNVLYMQPGAYGAPQVAGRSLQGITNDDWSKCHASGSTDPFPDTVAFVDETPSALRVAVQAQFTRAHPRYRNPGAGFDHDRVVDQS